MHVVATQPTLAMQRPPWAADGLLLISVCSPILESRDSVHTDAAFASALSPCHSTLLCTAPGPRAAQPKTTAHT